MSSPNACHKAKECLDDLPKCKVARITQAGNNTVTTSSSTPGCSGPKRSRVSKFCANFKRAKLAIAVDLERISSLSGQDKSATALSHLPSQSLFPAPKASRKVEKGSVWKTSQPVKSGAPFK